VGGLFPRAMRMAMIRPPSPESGTSSAGACTDWEPVLHAFFDGELNADDSLDCQPHLGRRRMKDLKSMRRKLRRSARGWGCAWRLAKIESANIGFRNGVRCRSQRKSASNGLPLGGRRERPGNRGTRDRLSPSRIEQKTRPLLLRGHHQNQQFDRGNPRIEKLYIFGNKARGNRVSYLA
jgi:hypothetical protein